MHLRRLFGPASFALVVLAACSGADVAAHVGAVDISHEQVAARADLFSFLNSLNQQPCGTPVDGESPDAACARFALGNLVQAEVTGEYAREHDIELDPKLVDDALSGFEANFTEPGGLERQLEDAGVTRSDLRDLAFDSLLGQQVVSAVTEERLGQDAIRREYEARQLRLTTVQVMHILVDTEQEAEDVYRQVTAPGATEKTFSNLAKRVSTDEVSGRNGGVLGSAVASQYVPEFAEAAVALEPGEISPPVQTDFGWHVIRLVTKRVTPYEEAKDGILRDLAGTEFRDWFQERILALDVEVNPRYGRFDRQSLQVEAVRSTDPEGSATPAEATGGATQQP
jgi:PPIC-type PPIASE domain